MTAPSAVRRPTGLDSDAMSLFPDEFCVLAKQWLIDSEQPGIAKVQTCAEVGRWETPCGLKVTLSDGWAVVVQFVGSYGPDSPRRPLTDEERVPLTERPDYRAARAADEAAAARVKPPPRSSKPSMRAREVLAIIQDLAKVTDLQGVEEVCVRVSKLYADPKPCLRVRFTDQSTVTGYVQGMLPPGSTQFPHPEHEVPAGWL